MPPSEGLELSLLQGAAVVDVMKSLDVPSPPKAKAKGKAKGRKRSYSLSLDSETDIDALLLPPASKPVALQGDYSSVASAGSVGSDDILDEILNGSPQKPAPAVEDEAWGCAATLNKFATKPVGAVNLITGTYPITLSNDGKEVAI